MASSRAETEQRRLRLSTLLDKSIRNEADVEAALELPTLVAIPWVSDASATTGNGKGRFWGKHEHNEKIGSLGGC